MHTHDPSWSTRLKLSLLAGGLAATLPWRRLVRRFVR